MKEIKDKPAAVIVGLNLAGLGIVRALSQHNVPTIGIDSDLSTPTAVTRYSRKICCPDLYSEGLVDILIDIGKKEKSKPILFLTIDENVLMVSKYREVLRYYFHFNIPGHHTVEILMNKELFAHFARDNGFLIPETFSASDKGEIIELSGRITYPCIMKPHYRGVRWEKSNIHKAFKIENAKMLIEQYDCISALNENVIIQEWIPGPDSQVYFCLLYFDSSSAPIASFVGKKIRQWPHSCGSTSLAVSCRQDFVLDESIRLLKAVGFKGMGSVEFKLDPRDGRFKIMEPTVGRANLQSFIAVASGINIPYRAYMDMLDVNHSIIPEQENGLKWINEDAEIYSLFYYFRDKKLNLREWFSSIRGRKSFALFSWSDPLPFLLLILKFFIKCVHKVFKVAQRLSVRFIKKTLKVCRGFIKRRLLPCLIINVDSIARPVHIILKRQDTALKILAYHRISDNEKDCLSADGIVSASIEEFDRQIEYIAKRYNAISFQMLSNYLDNQTKIPRDSVIITFDDGYKDNFLNAYPILKKYNLGATIFLTAGYIGKDKLFWWDEISYLVKKTRRENFKIYMGSPFEHDLSTDRRRQAAVISLLERVMKIPDEYRIEAIEDLRRQLEVDIDEGLAKKLILDWDEIRLMSKEGIEFGSHGMTHPVLSNASTERIRYELEVSKRIIEQEINKKVLVFSYPVGGNDTFDYRTRYYLEQAGYHYAVSYIHGDNGPSGLDRFCLKRIHVENQDSLSIFKSKLILPHIMRP